MAHIQNGVDHVLLSQNGMGIYEHPGLSKESGGPKNSSERLSYYQKLVQEVLEEKVGPNGEELGKYFKSVVIPAL